MEQSQTEHWERLFNKVKRDLEAENCQNFVDTTSIQQLVTVLERSALVYEQKNEVARLSNRLYPSLKHVESFVATITSISQYAPTGCLLWGAMQAVLLVEQTCKPEASYCS